MNNSELKKNIQRIKDLLKSLDFTDNTKGLDLAIELNDVNVFKQLLEGCGIDGVGRLVNEKNEISSYFICALSNVCDVPIAREIKAKLTDLNLGSSTTITNVDGLSEFTNITKLKEDSDQR